QPGLELSPRPSAAAGSGTGRDRAALAPSWNRAGRRGARGAAPGHGPDPATVGRPPGGADHAVRARDVESRDRASAGAYRRGDEGLDPQGDQATGRGDERDMTHGDRTRRR